MLSDNTKKLWDKIDLLKRNRPMCTDPDGHSMITYKSNGVKQCASCGHTEELIMKDD